MKFLLDHDVPVETAHLLRHWGHEALLLKEVLPADSTDEDVFAFAQKARHIIISCNRAHFLALAERAIKLEAAFSGLIILIRRRTRHLECAHLLKLLRGAREMGLKGNINYA